LASRLKINISSQTQEKNNNSYSNSKKRTIL
jgi:hypothetical protein